MRTTYEINPSAEVTAQACELVAGTWITVAWLDTKPQRALFLGYKWGSKKDGSYPKNFKGDRSLNCYYPDTGVCNDAAINTQVVAIGQELVVPA